MYGENLSIEEIWAFLEKMDEKLGILEYFIRDKIEIQWQMYF